MKLQFSLATLLVGVTVLALICVLCLVIPEHEQVPAPQPAAASSVPLLPTVNIVDVYRRPTPMEALKRLWALCVLIIAIVFIVIWFRRPKSRRHTEPPVG